MYSKSTIICNASHADKLKAFWDEGRCKGEQCTNTDIVAYFMKLQQKLCYIGRFTKISSKLVQNCQKNIQYVHTYF